MISLSVEDKCQNCPNFSPSVEQIDVSTLGEDKRIIQTAYCREKDFCKNIEDYLKKESK